MTAAALVMAKAPIPGRTKTRLEPLLGAHGCARLQAALIEQSLGWALAVAPGAAYVSYALAPLGALVPPGVDEFPQEDGDLGRRLCAATAHVGRWPLLVAGTDTPALSAAHVAEALAELEAGRDAVFGPALDGGYYLVALARPLPELFELPREAWGGPDVLDLSLRAGERAGLDVGLLRPERDLDTPEDAQALLAAGALPPPVAEALRAVAAR